MNFKLPFNGSWLTFWGGDNLEQNHHHDSVSQKYAFDFIQTDKNGKFFRTNGKNAEDYYSFGQDIVAPADGIVIEVVDGLRDNRPGELNNFNAIGNYVMLKHKVGLFSVLGHLCQNSSLRKAGESVKRGQKLGECGNSGNTTDPHLHFHAQNSDIFTKIDKKYKRVDIATGQKIYFEKIKIGWLGKQIAADNYSPVKGDVVGNVD